MLIAKVFQRSGACSAYRVFCGKIKQSGVCSSDALPLDVLRIRREFLTFPEDARLAGRADLTIESPVDRMGTASALDARTCRGTEPEVEARSCSGVGARRDVARWK